MNKVLKPLLSAHRDLLSGKYVVRDLENKYTELFEKRPTMKKVFENILQDIENEKYMKAYTGENVKLNSWQSAFEKLCSEEISMGEYNQLPNLKEILIIPTEPSHGKDFIHERIRYQFSDNENVAIFSIHSLSKKKILNNRRVREICKSKPFLIVNLKRRAEDRKEMNHKTLGGNGVTTNLKKMILENDAKRLWVILENMPTEKAIREMVELSDANVRFDICLYQDQKLNITNIANYLSNKNRIKYNCDKNSTEDFSEKCRKRNCEYSFDDTPAKAPKLAEYKNWEKSLDDISAKASRYEDH